MEVAAIATDWNFNEVARYQAAVKVSPRLAKRRMTGEFWDKNSTVREVLLKQNSTSGRPTRTIENELLDFLKQKFDMKQPIYLAGSSIHQDQKFIEREWPRLNGKLHYRQLDVSSWKVVFENHFGTKIITPEIHRAVDDIEGSIKELQIYLRKVR